MIIPSRRSFVTGLVALVAAPAIVKASSLMQVAPTEVIRLPRNSVHKELTRVWASHQSGAGLTVDPLTEVLKPGDIITIDGVERWYRGDNTPTRWLRQFVVTQRAEIGHRVVSLWPPIVGKHEPYYRTVVDLPMNKAIVRRV